MEAKPLKAAVAACGAVGAGAARGAATNAVKSAPANGSFEFLFALLEASCANN